MTRPIDVLLVEYQPGSIRPLLHVCESKHLRVEQAETPAEVPERLSECRADAMLLKVDRPGKHLGDVIECVRRHSDEVPILALSSRLSDAAALLRAGAREHLVEEDATPPLLVQAICSAMHQPPGGPEAGAPPLGHPLSPRLVFEDFELDPARRELRQRGRPLQIHLKPLTVLQFLIRNRDRAVSREELLEQVWGGVHVSEGAIASALKDLRHALGDDGSHQRMIRTLRGYGYQFVAPVRQAPSEKQGLRFLALPPFEKRGEDPQVERFASGLEEALTSELVALPSLRVVPRSSLDDCRAENAAPARSCEQARIQYVLHVAISRAEQQIRVGAQLLDLPQDCYLWAGYSDHDLREELALERELGRRIAQEVGRHLRVSAPGDPSFDL